MEIRLHIFFIVLLVLIIASHSFFRDLLFQRSMIWIKEIQAESTDAGVLLYKAISILGEGPAYVVVFLGMFAWTNRSSAFYYLLYICLAVTSINIPKMAYHEVRPYFIDKEVLTFGQCSAEYGTPSGHSLFVAAFCFMIYLDLCFGE